MPLLFKTILGGAAGTFAAMSNDPFLAFSIMAVVFWHKSQEDFR
jgi:hypothetical protein